jgi:hypothetical protein
MKAIQFQRLTQQYLLPTLPGFAAKGALVYATPLDYLLRGFYFEPSGSDPSSFYVWTFIQPLYVPTRHIYFTFGRRLGKGWPLDEKEADGSRSNGQHYQAGMASIMVQVLRTIEAEGLPFIGNIEHPVDLAYQTSRVTDAPDEDPYVVEAVIYSYILAGEYGRAREKYARLKRSLSSLENGLVWAREIAQRAAQVMDNLPRHPDNTVALLDMWTRQTARDLRLPEPQLTYRHFAGAI